MSSEREGRLRDYLRHRHGPHIIIEHLERYTRGSSRDTWFAEFRHAQDGPITQIVIRTDLPAGSSDPSSLEQEYVMYAKLGQTQVPVARVLWWEDDPRWLGHPMYAREKIEGSWRIENYSNPDPSYDALRIDTAKEHLRCLASVHSLDWRALGFDQRLPAPRDGTDAAYANIDAILERYHRIAVEGIPIMEEASEWLHDHAPVAPRIVLCKGTNGHGEEVFRDGRIVAMSDWEEASIGDPAADFAFMQDFAQLIERDGVRLWGLEQALEYYRQVSGVRVTPESVAYYQVLRCFRLAVLTHNAAKNIAHPCGATIRQTWTGTEVMHIAKHVLASAMGLLPTLSPQRFAELNVTVDTA